MEKEEWEGKRRKGKKMEEEEMRKVGTNDASGRKNRKGVHVQWK